MAVRKKVDIEEVQKKFFAQVQEEYDRFRYGQMKAGIDNVFKNSLKITFYKEVYRYLMDDVLHDDEYVEFLGEPIIEKLWDVFVVTELPRQTRDYLRQLIKLYRENNNANRRTVYHHQNRLQSLLYTIGGKNGSGKGRKTRRNRHGKDRVRTAHD